MLTAMGRRPRSLTLFEGAWTRACFSESHLTLAFRNVQDFGLAIFHLGLYLRTMTQACRDTLKKSHCNAFYNTKNFKTT